MKLYYSPGACSLAPHITIHEMGLTAEFESVDLKNKKTKSGQDFLKINPKGYVPVLALDNGEFVTENSVIHQYLADTNKKLNLLPPVGDLARYHILEWLNFISTELHKNFSPLFSGEVPQQLKEQVFIPLLVKKLNLVDAQLAKTKFIAGDTYTLPDAYLFTMLRWTSYVKIDLAQFKNASRYYKELLARPAFQKAIKEEGIEA